MADEKDIAGVVAMLGAAYPNFSPTEHTVEVYFQTLRDLPSELLRTAALHAISEAGRKFAPSVGELRAAAAEIQRRAANIPSSYQAWQEVMQAIREIGSYRPAPEFSHALVDESVRALGWRNLCMSENAAADRARFIAAYEQLEQRLEVERMMLPAVRAYIEARGGQLPAPAAHIEALAESLSKSAGRRRSPRLPALKPD
jgi:hypothetical protein